MFIHGDLRAHPAVNLARVYSVRAPEPELHALCARNHRRASTIGPLPNFGRPGDCTRKPQIQGRAPNVTRF